MGMSEIDLKRLILAGVVFVVVSSGMIWAIKEGYMGSEDYAYIRTYGVFECGNQEVHVPISYILELRNPNVTSINYTDDQCTLTIVKTATFHEGRSMFVDAYCHCGNNVASSRGFGLFFDEPLFDFKLR